VQEVDNWLIQEKYKAVEYLKANGFSFNTIRGFYWKKLKFNGNIIYLRIVLPQKFPLEYPKFYVDQKDWYLKYPHIERSKEYGVNICYVDNEDKVAIFDGKQLIEKELEKIYEIIRNYENGSFNKQDFLEEFDSYWGENFIYMDVHSNIEEPKIIDLLEVQKFKEVITSNIDKTKVILENMNLKIQKEKKVMFLPFFNKFSYPFPRTKNEVLKIIEALGYKTFLEENIEQVDLKVVFSFKIGDYTHYGAFKFAKPYKQLLVNHEIVPIGIRRIDRDRIFSRGGNDITSSIAKTPIKVAIVGCGSLGASLAFKLVKSGIKKFVFIDHDILTVSNIGRHICGMKYINQFKVNALKDFLIEQFPDLEIEVISKNATECLDRLSQTDLIISAVGSEGEGFEQLLLQMKHSKNEKISIPPIVLTWFEGAIAGQVVLIKETDIDDFPVFLEKVSVLEKAKKNELTKLDMGCNSSYSPYAFIDAENTVLHASLLITKYIASLGKCKEEVWTIFNDTEQYNEYLIENYKNSPAYSIQKQKLEDLI
jgi:hypothetical protein